MNEDPKSPSEHPPVPHPPGWSASAQGTAQPTEPDSAGPWKLALESSGDGVWDWDLGSGQQTFSPRWKEMLGYAVDEIGTGYRELFRRVHPDDLACLQASKKAFLQGDSPHNTLEFRMRCKDGAWKWILSRIMVVYRDAQGRPRHIIGTHTDIHARKQTEFALQELNARLVESTRRLQNTLSSISQGILMLDAEERVITFNPRVCELLDLPVSLLASRPSVQEVTRFQLERGDFGPHASRVVPAAQQHVLDVAAGARDNLPNHYLRVTSAGRTLEVRTQALPAGGMVRTFSDVTDYMQAVSARQGLTRLLEATQSIARIGGWEIDLLKDQVFWTAEVYRILETSAQSYTPSAASTAQFYTPESIHKMQAAMAAATPDGITQDLELEMVTARGRPIWVHSASLVIREQGRVVKYTTVLRDITEQKQVETALRESEQRWKLALESTGDGVWDWYIQTGEEFCSPRLIEMYGFAEGELENLAEELDARTHPDDKAQLARDRQAHFDGLTPTYLNEHRVRCKDGSWKWVLARGMVISRDAQNRPLRMIGTHTDITERKTSEERIWRQAHFDTLTGLPNRRMLRDRLEQEIKKSRRDGQQIAVLFIDLDHFKEVNDTLGHDQGDLLLVEAARRIQGCVRESDTVARMGGDEFTVILTELADASSLEGILQLLLDTLQTVFALGDERVFVSASIGVSMYPMDASVIEDLFKHADQALYVAKGAGRNRFSFFTPALQEAAQGRARLTNDLRQGLAGQQFRVVYQPIVELASGAIHKAEALIRWQHPVHGLVSPADFIPVAESSGLIVDIGEWVFQQAAAQVKRWRATLHAQFQISVNRSPVQFHHDSPEQPRWPAQLQAQGLPGDSIAVEITEGLLLDSSDNVTQQLLQLAQAGTQVALDDFGTGYSSLSYLQKFDIDFIKIDRSFVNPLAPGGTDLALCKAIIVMAHELGLRVIAEGVETPQQRDLLAAAGCDFAQGYLFARPMPAAEFECFVTRVAGDD